MARYDSSANDYKANYLFYGPATITTGTSFTADSSYNNTGAGYGVIDTGSNGIGNLLYWTDLCDNVVEETLQLQTDAESANTYTNANSKVGSIFGSPSEILLWDDFSNYVSDLSLIEDAARRVKAQAVSLNVNENLIVSGDVAIR